MNRVFKILIVVTSIGLLSCQTSDQNEVIDKLILFGHSGFCYRDSRNNVYPSDEIWKNDSTRLFRDSLHFDIRRYFEYDKDSVFKIAIRKPNNKTEFFILNNQDSLRLKDLINNNLLKKSYKSEYRLSDTIPMIYDGWHYNLYFRTSKGKDYLISYIPDLIPDSLRVIHDLIIKIINNPQIQRVSSFDFDSITNKEALKQFTRNPPPQVPSDFLEKEFGTKARF